MLGALLNVVGVLFLPQFSWAQSDCITVANRVLNDRGITQGRDQLLRSLCDNPEANRLEAEFQRLRRDFLHELSAQNEARSLVEGVQFLLLAQKHDLGRDLAEFQDCRTEPSRFLRCIARLRDLRSNASEYIADTETEILNVSEKITEANRPILERIRELMVQHLVVVRAHRIALQGGGGE